MHSSYEVRVTMCINRARSQKKKICHRLDSSPPGFGLHTVLVFVLFFMGLVLSCMG